MATDTTLAAEEQKAEPTTDDTLRQLLSDAISYIDEEISPLRAKATDYYFGRPFGNEQEGRSQVILTEVRDAVEQSIPSVMRLVFGPEHPVEFTPDTPERVMLAKEQTDYCRYVFEQENDGFKNTLAVLKDGCVRKLGVFKWAWDDTSEVTNYTLSNLDQDTLVALSGEPGVEITEIVPEANGLFRAEVKRTKPDGCVRIWSVPPEEFFWNRNARSLDDALVVGHRTRKTRSELIAMGIDPAVIDEHGGTDNTLRDNEEAIARDPFAEASAGSEEPVSDESEGFLYIEAYTRAFDEDGDGIAELRRICTLGPGYHVVSNDAVSEVPFADFCPIPEPHTMAGQSLADLTMDLQLTKSSVMRAMLDSAAASIFPRIWYKEGDASLADVLNTEVGAPIRTRSGPNAVGVFAHPFIGRDMLGVLAYFDEIKEGRVGRAGGAQGLHMDSMQSSTKAAVAAAVTDAQMRTEMIARIFAETLKRVFRGVARLYVAHQPAPKNVRIGNEWRRIDPRVWDAEMGMRINVMLGSGLTEEKIAMFEAIIAKQEQLMQMLGPNNPLVSFTEYRNALGEAVALRGRKDVDRFFKPFGQEQEQAMAQAAAQAQQNPQPESPEQIIAQAQIEIEKMKAERELAIKEAELAMKEREITMQHERELLKLRAETASEEFRLRLENDRERDRISHELALKREEIEQKYAAKVTEAEIKAEAQANRETTQAGPEGAE